jgi:hypothetical protein
VLVAVVVVSVVMAYIIRGARERTSGGDHSA